MRPADWPAPRALWQIDNIEPHQAAVGADTVVFVDEGSRTAIAVDIATGRKRWERAAPEIVPESLIAAGDLAIFSQRSGLTTAVAFADGATRWSIDLGCTLVQPTASASVVAGECYPLGERRLHGLAAVDWRTGARRWLLETADIECQPAHDDDTVYVASHDFDIGRVRAIEAVSGRERWRALIQDELTHAVVVDGVVVALGLHVHGLDAASGAILWRANRLDEDRPDPCDRTLPVHERLVLRPHERGIDGLEPATGRVAKTWTIPATVTRRRYKHLGLWSAGDALVAYVEYFGDDDPGSLLVWRQDGAQVLPLPAGWISRVDGRLALLTDDSWVATRALRLGPVAAPAIDPIPVVSSPRHEPEPACAWDDSLGGAKEGHLEIDLPAARYVRHRDALYFATDTVWRMELEGGPRWIGIDGAPDEIAVDDDFVYWGECAVADGCGDRGGGAWRLVRVARRNAARITLAREARAIDALAAGHGHVYWSSGGALRRMRRDGARVETLWRGAPVTEMVVAGDRLLFIAGGTLRSLPLAGHAPRVLATRVADTSPMASDVDHIYVATRPDTDRGSHALVAVPRGGGRVRRLLESSTPFQAIAAGEHRIFVAARDGEILAVGKQGGAPAQIVARDEPASRCGATWRLDVVGDSLQWIGGYRPGARTGILWRLTPPSR